MTIYEKIEKDRKDFSSDRASLALLLSEICVDGKPMADPEAIERLFQMRKVAARNVVLYIGTGNQDTAAEETAFMNLITTYLPLPASEDDIKKAIKALDIDYSMRNMGTLMKHLKAEFRVVDGSLVKTVLMGEK